jgi:hypothetical protein
MMYVGRVFKPGIIPHQLSDGCDAKGAADVVDERLDRFRHHDDGCMCGRTQQLFVTLGDHDNIGPQVRQDLERFVGIGRGAHGELQLAEHRFRLVHDTAIVADEQHEGGNAVGITTAPAAAMLSAAIGSTPEWGCRLHHAPQAYYELLSV